MQLNDKSLNRPFLTNALKAQTYQFGFAVALSNSTLEQKSIQNNENIPAHRQMTKPTIQSLIKGNRCALPYSRALTPGGDFNQRANASKSRITRYLRKIKAVLQSDKMPVSEEREKALYGQVYYNSFIFNSKSPCHYPSSTEKPSKNLTKNGDSNNVSNIHISSATTTKPFPSQTIVVRKKSNERAKAPVNIHKIDSNNVRKLAGQKSRELVNNPGHKRNISLGNVSNKPIKNDSNGYNVSSDGGLEVTSRLVKVRNRPQTQTSFKRVRIGSIGSNNFVSETEMGVSSFNTIADEDASTGIPSIAYLMEDKESKGGKEVRVRSKGVQIKPAVPKMNMEYRRGRKSREEMGLNIVKPSVVKPKEVKTLYIEKPNSKENFSEWFEKVKLHLQELKNPGNTSSIIEPKKEVNNISHTYIKKDSSTENKFEHLMAYRVSTETDLTSRINHDKCSRSSVLDDRLKSRDYEFTSIDDFKKMILSPIHKGISGSMYNTSSKKAPDTAKQSFIHTVNGEKSKDKVGYNVNVELPSWMRCHTRGPEESDKEKCESSENKEARLSNRSHSVGKPRRSRFSISGSSGEESGGKKAHGVRGSKGSLLEKQLRMQQGNNTIQGWDNWE